MSAKTICNTPFLSMKKRNDYCCVPQCTSWSKKNPDLSFFIFPRANERKVLIHTQQRSELMDRRKAWIVKLRILKPVSKYMKVCSLHFTDRDYFPRGVTSDHRRILKRSAVPSQKLPRTPTVSASKSTSEPSSSGKYQEEIGLSEYRNYLSTVLTDDELIALEGLLLLSGGSEIYPSGLE
ncbi:uncharacterized protein LOC123679700 [Harmonia axyridis]|uniref:uncharacterized protein LOC123679700 n=1 Tax=Harmonia axyridis TaxID=115357 RepID=UPI001E276787|nr:uncharacterized protein LOC123679700 [Harmonia axyridis]